MTIKEDCVDCVNIEFRAESLGFNHEEPKVFIQSQVCFLCLNTKSLW